MRNIYEIISEQKAIVDVNIANYDLMYTTNIFVKENEYIQEGFGDKVKSVIKSVIEFIKSLINKIREFVSKIFNFFRGGKNEVAKIENKLKEAKDKDNGGKKEEAKDDDKKEKGGSTEVKGESGTLINISFTGDATTLPQLLKVTKGKAVTTKIGPIEAKFDMVDKVFQVSTVFEKLADMEDHDDLSTDILTKTAKKIITGDENTNDVMSKVKEKLGDSDETVQFEISSKAGEIVKYLEYSQKLGVTFKTGANELIGDLNDVVRELEEEARGQGPDAEKQAALAASEIRKCCNLLTSTFTYVGQKALKGYMQYLRICRRLCDMYISSRLPNMDNKNRTKSRNQMINSVEKKDKFEEKAKEYGYDDESED